MDCMGLCVAVFGHFQNEGIIVTIFVVRRRFQALFFYFLRSIFMSAALLVVSCMLSHGEGTQFFYAPISPQHLISVKLSSK